MTDQATTAVELDVVICTYDNAEMLDQVLDALDRQRGDRDAWAVTVVFNNSPADTRAVVERHARRGQIPALRTVEEPEQGLTPARLRGVRSTSGRWIAFVDDDCILDDGWVEHTLAFAAAHPESGGFGGRVIPEYEDPVPLVEREYGWAFAEQDLGDEEIEVDCLVGAGMVLNRAALDASGWPDRQFFQDRVGHRLVSGGDVEIALRVAATGRPLLYTPGSTLRHQIPARRVATRYLVRIIRGLGVSSSISGALAAPSSKSAWARATARQLWGEARWSLSRARPLGRGSEGRTDMLFQGSYMLGRWSGLWRVGLLMARGRCDFYGRAASGASDGVPHEDGAHGVVRAD